MSGPDGTILLVEDEFLIAMDLKVRIEAAGYTVAGPVATVEDALALIEAGPVRAAILDMNIRGSTSFPVADRLAGRGIPFMFLSGNDASRLLDQFADRPVFAKPIDHADLLEGLAALCGG